MDGFVWIVIIIWLVAVGAWWFITRWSKSSDLDKMKSRLLGTPKKKAKSKDAQATSALFELEQGEKRNRIVVGLLKKYNLMDKTQELLEQAGLKWRVEKLVNMCLGGFILAYALGWLFAPAEVKSYLLFLAVAGGLLPIFHVIRLRKKRLHAFEEVFPDCLEFISRSMRAGHAFSVSLEMIYKEFNEPLAGEFKRTFEEHNLGLPLDVALVKLAKRVPLLDVHFFVSAVMLQKRTGGNLAEILDKLAYVIRERFKLRGKIRAVSAHGRMTGMALSSIPLVVAFLMFLTNPPYVEFFFKDETGNILALIALGLQIIGYMVMQKIVQIEV